MEIVEVFGYLSALLIGISLGLVGGGGSILAVPVLAYLFAVNEKMATAYSLFIVGASSLVGGLKQNLKGYVDWKTAIVFGIPAIVGVSLDWERSNQRTGNQGLLESKCRSHCSGDGGFCNAKRFMA